VSGHPMLGESQGFNQVSVTETETTSYNNTT
jgi:hypothetical protein